MASSKKQSINNDFYDQYNERWYTAKDDPVALLRAEAKARNPWINSEITKWFKGGRVRILDIGCGAGFLANDLARQGYHVVGLDSSWTALDVARRYDLTGTVDYICEDAYKLSFESGVFDVVCAMDFLEHIERPNEVVREISRVLKARGLFFYYTFNRNILSWLIVIKGVEWFVHNTPPEMHCLRYFIKPAELEKMCSENEIEIVQCRGMAPKILNPSFWKMLASGKIDEGFSFRFTRHRTLGYLGMAIRSPRTA
jgi:2-polyprenyl-6-hydroxyphenyl methylase/3-demethylubiquinone-9 3-methyltransferase